MMVEETLMVLSFGDYNCVCVVEGPCDRLVVAWIGVELSLCGVYFLSRLTVVRGSPVWRYIVSYLVELVFLW